MKPAPFSLEDARRYYEDGAERWRRPHKKLIPGTNRDADSMDFRGVRAALNVDMRDTAPDGSEHKLTPNEAKERMELGLAAVNGAGLLPLDPRFVAGYERIANMVSQPETIDTEKLVGMPTQDPFIQKRADRAAASAGQ